MAIPESFFRVKIAASLKSITTGRIFRIIKFVEVNIKVLKLSYSVKQVKSELLCKCLLPIREHSIRNPP
jgi:hypothetical protein